MRGAGEAAIRGVPVRSEVCVPPARVRLRNPRRVRVNIGASEREREGLLRLRVEERHHEPFVGPRPEERRDIGGARGDAFNARVRSARGIARGEVGGNVAHARFVRPFRSAVSPFSRGRSTTGNQ